MQVEKVFYITSINEMSEGLFGQVLLRMMNNLPIIEQMKIDPSFILWDVETERYGKIFPNILEYKSNISCNMNLQNTNVTYIKIPPSPYTLGDNFYELNKLFFKYFKIPNKIVDLASEMNLDDYLGIHFRGTDKTDDSIMNTKITMDVFISIIKEYIDVNKINNIFVCTDEKEFVDKLKLNLSNNNINFKFSRNFDLLDQKSLTWYENIDKYNNGPCAMIDMICLSKCKSVLKNSSALSSFAKLINPTLEIYRVNSCKMFNPTTPYFPDAFIPLLNANINFTDKTNNILNDLQKDDWTNNSKLKEFFSNYTYKLQPNLINNVLDIFP